MQIEFHNRKKEERKTHVTQLSRPAHFKRTTATATEETTVKGEKELLIFHPYLQCCSGVPYIFCHETSNCRLIFITKGSQSRRIVISARVWRNGVGVSRVR